MPAFKMTMYFAIDKYSWTETHLVFVSGSAANPTTAAPLALQLANLRIAILGNQAQMFKIRIAQVIGSRQVFDLLPGSFPVGPVWGPDPTGLLFNAARPFEALQIQLSDGQGNFKNTFLSGLPTSLMHSYAGDRTGMAWYSAAPDLSPRVLTYTATLTNGNYGWASRRDSVLSQVQALVTNATFPNMIGVVVNAQIPALQVGTQMLLKNWRRINVKSPKLGGVWTCGGVLPPTAPATQWTYFLLNSGAVSPTNFKAMGLAGPLTISTHTYVFTADVGVTQRKRGASAGAPRGRVRSRF